MAYELCGQCCYLNVSCLKEGTYKCDKLSGRYEREYVWKFANSKDAENCRYFCERLRRDAHLGEQAIRQSEQYQASNGNGGGCFITTAVVNILGMNDECDELNTLRKFRKDYMQKHEACRELLLKYDTIGPALATAIKNAPNSREIAQDLYLIYIKGAVGYIKKQRYGDAIDLYKEMTENLISEFIMTSEIGPEFRNQYDMTNGGHGKSCLT